MAMPRSQDARLYYRCADRRRIESRILIKADQPTGAVYLAGYVVECMLKSLIIETQPSRIQVASLEAVKRIGHNFARLLELYIQGGGKHPPVNIVRAFSLASDWPTEIRYDPKEVATPEAELFLKAVDEIYRWVDERL